MCVMVGRLEHDCKKIQEDTEELEACLKYILI